MWRAEDKSLMLDILVFQNRNQKEMGLSNKKDTTFKK